jgi:putative drug exporter of the RND superfamily
VTTTSPPTPRAAQPPLAPPDPEPSPPSGLARLADIVVRRRRRVVVGWIAALVLVAALGPRVAGEWEADYDTPGSESGAVSALLAEHFGDAGSGDTIEVVWRAPGGVDGVRAAVDE